MTKPDKGLIRKMVRLREKDPNLGIKTAAREVARKQGYKGKDLERVIERLRSKYRRERDRGTLPEKAPIPEALLAHVNYLYEDIPKRNADQLIKSKRLRKELNRLGADLTDPAKQLQVLHREREDIERILSGPASAAASRIYSQYPDSREDALAALQEAADRKEWLDEVIPLLEALRYVE